MQPEEIKPHLGKRISLTLAPGAIGGPTVTGRLMATIDAADGLVVLVEPDGSAPGVRLSVHYHHIVSMSPAAS